MITLQGLFAEYGANKTRADVAHYGEFYESLLPYGEPWFGTMLEIGVQGGGSLTAWREWLCGVQYLGIDDDPRCRSLHNPPMVQIVIGHQQDADTLDAAAALGPYGLIVDDGSHMPDHQWASLLRLWPCLLPGGWYVVEDVGAGWWPDVAGEDALPFAPSAASMAVTQMNRWAWDGHPRAAPVGTRRVNEALAGVCELRCVAGLWAVRKGETCKMAS